MAGLEANNRAVDRKTKMKIVITFLLFFLTGSLHAEDQRFPFSNPEQVEQFRKLTEELRCLVCQNQSLADSDAELANDLRKKVYQLMDEGKTNDEIIEELVSRYGEFVLYRPRLNAQTYLLWFAPIILVLIGIIAIVLMMRRRSDSVDVKEVDLQNVRKLLEEEE